MDKTRFGTDRISLALEFTPELHPCPGNCSKCERSPWAETGNKCGSESQELFAYKRPEVADAGSTMKTPEQRDLVRRLHATLNPELPSPETLSGLYAFERPPVIDEKIRTPIDLKWLKALHATLFPQRPDHLTMEDLFAIKRPAVIDEGEGATEEVIDKTEGILRAVDSEKTVRASVVTRAQYIHADKLVAESKQHTREGREEWTQNMLKRRR